MKNIPVALSIAGSDSCAGAGIQADLKTFMSLNVYGTTAVTSITAQNTKGIQQIFNLPGHLVYQQIKSVIEDIGINSAKTGMLSNNDIILNVSNAIKDFEIKNLIVDPVINAKDGTFLLEKDSLEFFKEKILNFSLIVTPNLFESEILSEIKIISKEDMIKAAKKINKLGPQYVVIKGGHLTIDDDVIDLIYSKDHVEFIEYKRIGVKNVHGLGCTLSAAITAFIAKGYDVISSIKNARMYIQNKLQNGIMLGNGSSLLNHGGLWKE